MLLRRCRQLMGEENHALDAMQDVFARLLVQGHPSPEFPSSFLYTMATRICLDKLKSAAFRHGGNEELLLTLAAAGDIEETSVARRLLDRLFHRQAASTRVMAVMHYVDGMSLAEVAEYAQLTEAGVRRRLEKLRVHGKKLAGNGWQDRARVPYGKESP
jgi:RNA polymerase sigma-70 factor, ECF subfamily